MALKPLGICLLAGLLWTVPGAMAAHVDVENAFRDCRAIASEPRRLNCYDVLAAKLQLDRKDKAAQAHSDWIVSSKLSPLDDMTNVYMLLRAAHDVQTKFFGKVRPRLWFQCVRGKTTGLLEWGFIVGGDQKTVTYRLDRDEARTVKIDVSEDFSALVSWDQERVVRFIESLFGKQRLLVEITPFSDPPILATFNIGGIESAIAPLRKACGW